MGRKRNILTAALVLLLAFGVASADDPEAGELEQLRTAIHHVAVGNSVVVVERDGWKHAGQFTGLSGDTLSLLVRGESFSVPISDIAALYERGRSTRTGAYVGGSVGAVTLGFAGVVVVGMTGYGNNPEEPSVGEVFAVGAAVGAIVGGLSGAAIGAGAPKWHKKFEIAGGAPEPRNDIGRMPAPELDDHAIGGLGIYGGPTVFSGDGGSSVSGGFRADYRISLDRHFEFGPEAGWYWLNEDHRIRHLSGMVRFNSGGRNLKWYIVMDVGTYLSVLDVEREFRPPTEERSYFGYGLGGGIMTDAANDALSFGLEVRRHGAFSEVSHDVGFLTVMGVIRANW